MRPDNRQFDTDAIRRDYPVEQVVAGYGIALHQRGTALVGLCLFHDDREHPNLHVYPAKASWYCYACADQPDGWKTGGDVIRFVQLIERVDFLEACRRLVGRPAAPPRPSSHPAEVRARRQWDRLSIDEQDLLNRVAAHYHQQLDGCVQALAYVRSRGIPDRLIADQQLGYADGRSLRAAFREPADIDHLVDLGLLNRQDPEHPDCFTELFRHRVLVPELRGGNCIWLIGRTLVPDRDDLKYLALSGERPILGLERASGHAEVLMCEGVFDYLTALAWEFPAFSTCGTYLPCDRLGFLARASAVFAVFDPDAAGRLASGRFAALLGQRLRQVALPPRCDLNDLGTRTGGREQFLELLASAHNGSQEVNQCA